VEDEENDHGEKDHGSVQSNEEPLVRDNSATPTSGQFDRTIDAPDEHAKCGGPHPDYHLLCLPVEPEGFPDVCILAIGERLVQIVSDQELGSEGHVYDNAAELEGNTTECDVSARYGGGPSTGHRSLCSADGLHDKGNYIATAKYDGVCEGFQTTVLWPEVMDNSPDDQEVRSKDERWSDNGGRNLHQVWLHRCWVLAAPQSTTPTNNF